MVGDHLYVSGGKPGVQRLVELAENESCSASGSSPPAKACSLGLAPWRGAAFPATRAFTASRR